MLVTFQCCFRPVIICAGRSAHTTSCSYASATISGLSPLKCVMRLFKSSARLRSSWTKRDMQGDPMEFLRVDILLLLDIVLSMARQARIVIPGLPHHGVHCGNLWANRFYSSVLDGDHLWKAVCYVELNPVRAGIAAQAGQWEWSSARAHLGLAEDRLLSQARPFPGQWAGEWQAFLDQQFTSHELAWIRQNIATGRPTASKEFIDKLESDTGKVLNPQTRGRKPATGAAHVIDLTEDMFG